MANFKLIAITPDAEIKDEISFVSCILDSGFDYVHIRKPSLSEHELMKYIESIPSRYYDRLKIHNNFTPALRYNLAGIHLNRFNKSIPDNYGGTVSKSCHRFKELENLTDFEYVFLSPIFDSISKSGYKSSFTYSDLVMAKQSGTINSKVIALGGITPDNLATVKDWGFGGAAFLGYLFNSANLQELDYRIHKIITLIR